LEEVGNYRLKRTSAVGIYPRDVSPYGVYDMGGNVGEWTLSLWRRDYQHHLAAEVDRESDHHRTLRGGLWFQGIEFCRTAVRWSDEPSNWDSYTGFRVAAVNPVYPEG
jgi:formylglycine-generating enzyme required for sulfatase activity